MPTFNTNKSGPYFLHDMNDFHEEWKNNNDDENYDIDTPVTHIDTKMNRQFSRRQSHQPMRSRRNDGIPKKAYVNMPWDRWKQLSDETRTLWDSLSDENKAIILGHSSMNTVPEMS
jgi:hypothetical protein